jgi:hypothetical protein
MEIGKKIKSTRDAKGMTAKDVISAVDMGLLCIAVLKQAKQNLL